MGMSHLYLNYDYQRTYFEYLITKLMANKSTSLLRLVEDRALLKKEEKREQQENFVPYIPKECISNILGRLPLESLQRARFVCKPWYKLVNSSIFIDSHLRRSETVLIFLTEMARERFRSYPPTLIPLEKANYFSIEANLFQPQSIPLFPQPRINPRSQFYIQFMEISDGKGEIRNLNVGCSGQIRATCNGLVLLENKMKKGGLIVVNPVNRKLTELPVGTLYPSHNESYGLALCSSTGEYKLVHLFQDEMHYIGCEILVVGTRSWKAVDGPSFGLFSWLGFNPVSAIGGLHWIPDVDRSDYIVSMTLDDEKFHKVPLPKTSRSEDGIVEIGGSLCFVIHEETNQVDIWSLSSLYGENWIKQHSITLGCFMDMIPLYCSRNKGEMIFKDKDGSLFAYDFQLQVVNKVGIEKGFPFNGRYLPHVNSLVSWL